VKKKLEEFKDSLDQQLKNFKFDLFDLIILFLPIISFGYAWYVYLPGALTFDSYNQLTQIKTLTFTAGHPLVHTLLELLLLKVWNNPAVIGLFQILTFSVIWTVICKYNRRNNKGLILGLFQILITLFICINPFNTIHSITLWKDILYSYSILLLSFLFQVIIEKNFLLKDKEIIFTAFILVLIGNLRHNGLIITLGCFIILTLILLIRNFRNKNWIKLIFCTLIFFILFRIPTKILIPDSTPLVGSFNYKVLHLTADYYHKDFFVQEEKNFLSSFISLEDFSLYYNPYFADPIGNVEVDQEIYIENETKLKKMLLKKTFEKPSYFLDYLGNSTVILWKINLPADVVGTVLTTGYDASNNIDDIQQIHSDKEFFQKYNEYIDTLFSNKITEIIFFSPAFYFYLSLILIFLGFLLRVLNFSYFLILLPNVLNLIGLAISIPVQDARYVYVSFLVGYLTMVVLISKIVVKKAFHSK